MKKRVVIIICALVLLISIVVYMESNNKKPTDTLPVLISKITSTPAVSKITVSELPSDTPTPTTYKSPITPTVPDVAETVEPEYTEPSTTVAPLAYPYVEDIITNLLTLYDSKDMSVYLSTISTTEDFTFEPVVDKSTAVSIFYIGDNSNSSYLGVVNLSQSSGTSTFAVKVSFTEDGSLCSFIYDRIGGI